MSCGMARLASGESVPGFAEAPSSQSAPAMRTTESPRTSASGRIARRTRRRAMQRAVGLGVVAGGQDDPAPVTTNEVDRQRIGQPLVDVADPHGHARAKRVDALELRADNLRPAAPDGWRNAQSFERSSHFLACVRDLLRDKPSGLEGQVPAREADSGCDRIAPSV